MTGQRLFQRRSELDTLRAVQMSDVPALATVRPDMPPALAAAIETALEPRAEDRWDTAADMAHALLAWLSSAGETPSKTRLAATMARLFGGDAAERRLAAVSTPSDATAANLMLPPPDVPSEPRLSPLNQIAMHLHLPPPRLPPWRIAGPLLALVLSAGWALVRAAIAAGQSRAVGDRAGSDDGDGVAVCGALSQAGAADAASRRGSGRAEAAAAVGDDDACAKPSHAGAPSRSAATETRLRGMMGA